MPVRGGFLHHLRTRFQAESLGAFTVRRSGEPRPQRCTERRDERVRSEFPGDLGVDQLQLERNKDAGLDLRQQLLVIFNDFKQLARKLSLRVTPGVIRCVGEQCQGRKTMHLADSRQVTVGTRIEPGPTWGLSCCISKVVGVRTTQERGSICDEHFGIGRRLTSA